MTIIINDCGSIYLYCWKIIEMINVGCIVIFCHHFFLLFVVCCCCCFVYVQVYLVCSFVKMKMQFLLHHTPNQTTTRCTSIDGRTQALLRINLLLRHHNQQRQPRRTSVLQTLYYCTLLSLLWDWGTDKVGVLGGT